MVVILFMAIPVSEPIRTHSLRGYFPLDWFGFVV